MTDRHEQPRREFLQHLMGAGVAIAGTGLLSGCAMATSSAATAGGPASPSAPETWDMSWTQRLARHRTAYDSPEVQDGAALGFADAMMTGYKATGVDESKVTAVIILRHAASVMTLNDAMWDRLALGERTKLKDPTTGETTRRNPFINYHKDDKHSAIDENSGIDTLMRRGAIILTCNRALTGVAYQLRKKEPQFTPETALAEIRRNVLPGVYVMPNGIFAVSAAQDAGCHYMRVLV
ncbi:MAG: hypothetical protein ABJE47_07075 [bacterium]